MTRTYPLPFSSPCHKKSQLTITKKTQPFHIVRDCPSPHLLPQIKPNKTLAYPFLSSITTSSPTVLFSTQAFQPLNRELLWSKHHQHNWDPKKTDCPSSSSSLPQQHHTWCHFLTNPWSTVKLHHYHRPQNDSHRPHNANDLFI